MKFWNFPSFKGGNINSINNAGLETFRDNPIESLTREICQNSLDAIKDRTKPVIVEFKSFSTDKFPNKQELINIFKKCKSTWKGKNKKSEEFINKALTTLEKPEINFLRISDFNTIGLKGAESGELGEPWSSLIKEAGSSNKQEDSGGSFGIGKSAPFLVSDLRTLFYSSYAIDNYKSHIGVSNIMSYITETGEVTSGIGYYTNTQDSRAIPNLIQLDNNFFRNETGTDIYVSAFKSSPNWETEIIKSVLHNFFITVFEKMLIVRVNDIEINHENLEELINSLDDSEENRNLKNYYLLLSSEEKLIKYPARKYRNGISFDEGEATLYLMGGENLNRRVLMTRKNGMQIYEQDRFSASISFTGILRITGNNMNSIFKEMENPAHNGWSANRYEDDPKLAEKIFKDLRRFMREKVKETFQINVSDEMDAVGLSDFLPNKNLVLDSGKKEIETINKSVNDIKVKKKKSFSNKRSTDPTENLQQILGQFGITDGSNGGSIFNGKSSGDGPGQGVSDIGGNNDLDKDSLGSLDLENKESTKIKPVSSSQKYICIDKRNGLYKFHIIPNNRVSKGELRFTVLGEQNLYKLPIVNANFLNKDLRVIKIHNNIVYFDTENGRLIDDIILNLEIDYPEYCTIEVSLYEN